MPDDPAEPFYAAIRAAPDDDLPRLVFADWLDEHGQPERAEFIRVQCHLARLASDDAQRADLITRECQLRTSHAAAWLAEEWKIAVHHSCRFERGFVTALAFRGELSELNLTRATTDPVFDLVRELDLQGCSITPGGLRALNSPRYTRLLEFVDWRSTDVHDRPPLPALSAVLVLAELWGNAPVQASGWVGPHPFYFRARHEHWSFGLSETPGLDPSDIYESTDHSYYVERDYGTSPFAASYMPSVEAIQFVRECGREYVALRRMGR